MASTQATSFPAEWLRGLTPLAVISVLASTPMHGYAIGQALEEAGIGKVKGGTFYPILAKLEAQNIVSSEWEHADSGPGRKIFTLTEHGKQHATAMKQQWASFANSINQITNNIEG